MGQTGIGSQWSSIVTKAGNETQQLPKLKPIQLTKTDSSSFKNFDQLIETFNQSISNFKNFQQQETQKMIKAGENKAQDDQVASRSLSIQGG